MLRITLAAIVAAAGMTLASVAQAQPNRVEVETLTCSMSSDIGLIIGSQRNLNCIFRGGPGEPEESYRGTMTRVGLDIGVTSGQCSRIRTVATRGCLPAPMAARPPRCQWLPVSARMCLSADQTALSHCSHCRCRNRSGLISRQVSESWSSTLLHRLRFIIVFAEVAADRTHLGCDLLVEAEVLFDGRDALQRVVDFAGEACVAGAQLRQPLDAAVNDRYLRRDVAQLIVVRAESRIHVLEFVEHLRFGVPDLPFHACDLVFGPHVADDVVEYLSCFLGRCLLWRHRLHV
jgi:Protein of unknown function (DUF992)